MGSGLLRLLHVRPGESGRLVRVAAIGAAYAAATAIGNDVAESIFVTRVGAQSLPMVFLAKGLLDVVAAALYLPLARGRSERAVWVTAIALYSAVVIGGRLLVTSGSDASAYALFIGHEAAWTILTIHWGVYLLDVFDASQARRLFPLLFTTARFGGILAGLLVGVLAAPIGAANLLFVGAALAGVAGALAIARPDAPQVSANASLRMEAAAPEDDDDGDRAPADGLVATWRRAVASPLVRAIALSTGAMVLVRYGLQMIALDRINLAMGGDNTRVAAFLGLFGAVANSAGILIGILIVPRILARLGAGFANVLYAVGTLVAYGLLLVWPSLATAAVARGVRVQLKDALKTPLSTLFYGAEPPERRAGARSFIFGAAIPVATVIAAGALEAGRHGAHDLALVTWGGLAIAILFVAASALQNRRWRTRMIELLELLLTRTTTPAPAGDVAAAQEQLRAAGTPEASVDRLARGLTAADPRVSALAAEILAETVPRHRAHQLSSSFRRWRR